MAKTTKPAQRADTSIVGSTGLRQFGGYVAEEFLKELSGTRGMRTYREMADNDAVIGAILFAVTMLMRKTKWSFQAADDSAEGDAAKDFAEEVFSDMTTPMSTVMSEICSMFVYGYAPMEIIWKRRLGPEYGSGEGRSKYNDGKIGIRALSLRAQTSIVRWEIDEVDGSIDGVHQQPVSGGAVFIPIEKLLLFRTLEERNNPEGRSLLRNAYRSWFFKKRIEEIEGVGVERDLAGLPVAKIPQEYFDPTAEPKDKAILAAWQQLVTRVRRDQQEGILIPSTRDDQGHPLFEFELLSTGGSRSFDTTKIIDRYDRRIATSVLADFIFLGQQSVGSFALSSDKTALFAAAIGGFMTSIADVFNMHLMPRIWQLNALDYENMPTLKPGDLESPDLAGIAEFISKLSAAGAPLFPDRELENHVREMAGLPLAPEDGGEDFVEPGEDAETPPGGQETPEDAAAREAAAVEKRKQQTPAPMVVVNNVTPLHKKTFQYDSDGLLIGISEDALPAAGAES